MTNTPHTITSLLGQPLSPPALPEATQARLEAQLAEAQAAYERDPGLEQTIWYGRRAGYLLQLERAAAIYSEGIARFPEAYQLYRHRGHRYISLRRFDLAVADLERAVTLAEGRPVEVEPDGAPNRLGLPLSNGHFNSWYHLGLAHYLRGDFAAAIEAYRSCLRFCDNDDSLVATSDWLYMSYRRQGDEAAAATLLEPIHAGMTVIEDQAYLNRLLLYKGELAPAALLDPADTSEDAALNLATQGYGLGNWHLYNGRRDEAMAIFRQVLTTGSWAAFGYIASEVEVARGAAG